MALIVLPDATEVRVSGLPTGALVGMALGLKAGREPIPGGAELGIVPISQAESVRADEFGNALVRVAYPAGTTAGLEFLAQIVIHSPGVPLQLPGRVTVGPVERGVVPHPGDEADLVVFFGQSNCEGWAPVESLPPGLRGAHPGLRIWHDAAGAFQAVEAGHNTSMVMNAPFFGAEIGMALAAAGRPRPLWLVKAARSPSTLGPSPGPFSEWGAPAGELYSELLARLARAAGELRRLGYAPRVRLIAMMQGESDAAALPLAHDYGSHLEHLLTQLRSDLRELGLADAELPWLRLGLVNRHLVRLGFVGAPLVRAAQTTVAGLLARSDTVETSTLELLPDGLHFAASGLLNLGRRFVAGQL